MTPTPKGVTVDTDTDGVTWLTRKEAAQYCRVRSERTIDRWAEEGRITRYRAEGLQSVRFKRAELDALFVAEDAEGSRTEENKATLGAALGQTTAYPGGEQLVANKRASFVEVSTDSLPKCEHKEFMKSPITGDFECLTEGCSGTADPFAD
jgi:excisionase family DNA binding protein